MVIDYRNALNTAFIELTEELRAEGDGASGEAVLRTPKGAKMVVQTFLGTNFEKVPIPPDPSRVLPGPSDPFRVLPSASECFRVFPSPYKCFRVLRIPSECLRVLPSPSESFRVLPSPSESFRVLRVLPSPSESFRVLRVLPSPSESSPRAQVVCLAERSGSTLRAATGPVAVKLWHMRSDWCDDGDANLPRPSTHLRPTFHPPSSHVPPPTFHPPSTHLPLACRRDEGDDTDAIAERMRRRAKAEHERIRRCDLQRPLPQISPDLTRSHQIPQSPHISPYLPISPQTLGGALSGRTSLTPRQILADLPRF